MRLDIGLVHRRVRIAPLDDDISVAEARVDVALRERDDLGDVGRVCRLEVHPLREKIVVQNGRVGFHRRFDIDDVWQDVVGDLDQLAGLFGDRG